MNTANGDHYLNERCHTVGRVNYEWTSLDHDRFSRFLSVPSVSLSCCPLSRSLSIPCTRSCPPSLSLAHQSIKIAEPTQTTDTERQRQRLTLSNKWTFPALPWIHTDRDVNTLALEQTHRFRTGEQTHGKSHTGFYRHTIIQKQIMLHV